MSIAYFTHNHGYKYIINFCMFIFCVSISGPAYANVVSGNYAYETGNSSGGIGAVVCSSCGEGDWRTFSLASHAANGRGPQAGIAINAGTQLQPGGYDLALADDGTDPVAENAAGALSASKPAADQSRIVRQVRRMQIAFHVLNAIDGAQIIALTSNGKLKEANPLYGKHPAAEKVIGIKLASSVLHQLISDRVLRRSPKAARTFELVSIAIQGGAVLWNLKASF